MLESAEYTWNDVECRFGPPGTYLPRLVGGR